MKKLTIVSGNQGKIREFEQLLDIELDSAKIDLPEIQTTDVEEVVRVKATEAYKQIGKPCFVDDTGLVVKCWGELPGALIKWFLENVGNEGILRMLGGSPREAYVKTALGYCDENGAQVFTGVIHGRIADKAKGENGFGFDEIFIPDGYDKTAAEMSADEKNQISWRAQAAMLMKNALEKL